MAEQGKEAARAAVEASRGDLLELSHRIHANPELAFEEYESSEAVANALEAGGFDVVRGAHDLPTAFVATTGSGPLNIAICAEYDALPAVGHACGHNIIASSAVGAGLALAGLAAELGMTVKVIGTPAEERGERGGKILLLERGAFDGVHAAMMVHPHPMDVAKPKMIAAAVWDVVYTGKEAHAAAWPWLGINAADALTVAQTAIGLLRQHLIATDRVHGIITKGGDAPNIIPAHTSARYMARSERLSELQGLRDRVVRCFEAGALATGATMQIVGGDFPYAHVEHDAELAGLYQANAEALGRTFVELDAASGSTDMGNVSLAIPSIHPFIGIDSGDAVNHQPEFAEACVSPAADLAVIDGATALAWTAIDIATSDALRTRLMSQATEASGNGKA